MMDRNDEVRACGVCHFNRLLGRTMRLNPRVISANRHDRDVDGAMSSDFCETVRHRSIASENDPQPFSLEQIAIVATICVPPFSRAPVIHRQGTNIDLACSGRKSSCFPQLSSMTSRNRVCLNRSLVAPAVITVVLSPKQRNVRRSR